jgi:hypothetical protein
MLGQAGLWAGWRETGVRSAVPTATKDRRRHVSIMVVQLAPAGLLFGADRNITSILKLTHDNRAGVLGRRWV